MKNDISSLDTSLLAILKKGPSVSFEAIPTHIDIDNREDIFALWEFAHTLIHKKDLFYLNWYQQKKNGIDLSDPILTSLLLFCHAHICYYLEKDHYAYFYSALAKPFFKKYELWKWFLYLKKLDFLIAERNGFPHLFLKKLRPVLDRIPLSELSPFLNLFLYFFCKYNDSYYLSIALRILQADPKRLKKKKVQYCLLKSFLEEKIPEAIVNEFAHILYPIYKFYEAHLLPTRPSLIEKKLIHMNSPSIQHESEYTHFVHFQMNLNKIIERKTILLYRNPKRKKWIDGLLKMEEQKRMYETHLSHLKKEIEQAKRFVKSFTSWYLPDTPYVRVGGFIFYAQEIGGDFISCEEFDEDEFLLFIGDTTGQGLYAALIVAMAKAFLKTKARDLSPIAILGELSDLIQNLQIEGLYMACALVKVKKNQVSLYGAGLPSALVYRAQSHTLEKYSLSGLWLGIPLMVPQPYSFSHITLNRNDVLMIYTDGILSYLPDQGHQIIEEHFQSTMKAHFAASVFEINNALSQKLSPYTSKKRVGDFSYVLIKGIR